MLTPLVMHVAEHYCEVATLDVVVQQGEVANLDGAHAQVEAQPAPPCLPMPIQPPPRPIGK